MSQCIKFDSHSYTEYVLRLVIFALLGFYWRNSIWFKSSNDLSDEIQPPKCMEANGKTVKFLMIFYRRFYLKNQRCWPGFFFSFKNQTNNFNDVQFHLLRLEYDVRFIFVLTLVDLSSVHAVVSTVGAHSNGLTRTIIMIVVNEL